jgi:predicted aldo/keto reductase-like oxidoreductase
LAGGAIDDATLALRFVAGNPAVTVVIPGMADQSEADQNLAAILDDSPLTDLEQEKIAKIRNELGTQFCRRCNYCAPCAAGMTIYSQFLFEGYYNRYGLKEWSSARYHAQQKKASDCIECGVCESRCPYNLPIRDMMKRVAKLFGE